MIHSILSFILGYFIGTVNPAAFLAKRKQHDLTESGTGNLGATNTMLAFGVRCGVFVLAFDMLKASIAVILSKLFLPASAGSGMLAGFGAVVGHIYPYQLKFKGGKGSACFAGVVLAHQPVLFIPLVIICVSLGLILDYAFVVPVSAVILFPFWAAWRARSLSVLLIAAAMGVLILCKHKENFLAVRTGTEGKFRSWFAEKIRARKESSFRNL